MPLDRDRAIITLVDSNIQRENILPSERAFAYKMKLEAMKRQGYRTDLTSSQVGTKLRTDETVAQGFGMAKTAVRPKIIVQAAYTGGANMRELFISLLVNEVRREKSSPRTFEIIKLPQYNEGSTDTKEAS